MLYSSCPIHTPPPIDTAFLNVQRLRAALLIGLSYGDDAAPDYLGKPLRIFSFKGQNLTHMQGGGYVLSRRAAIAVATCELGPWRNCPSSVFRDMKDKNADAMIRQRCDWPATNAEDLMTGVCMHQAGMVPKPHPCMLTLGAATSHRRPGAIPPHLLARVKGAAASDASAASLGELDGELAALLGDINETSANLTVTIAPTKVMTALDLARLNPSYVAVITKFKSNPRCPCPITAHPLKGDGLLQMAREASFERGCIQTDAEIAEIAQGHSTLATSTSSHGGDQHGPLAGASGRGGRHQPHLSLGAAIRTGPSKPLSALSHEADQMTAALRAARMRAKRAGGGGGAAVLTDISQAVVSDGARPLAFGASSQELLAELNVGGAVMGLAGSTDANGSSPSVGSIPTDESTTMSELNSIIGSLDSSAEAARGRGRSKKATAAQSAAAAKARARRQRRNRGSEETKSAEDQIIEAALSDTSEAEHAPSPGASLATAAAASSKRNRVTWTLHSGRNCYPGMGAVHLGQTRTGGKNGGDSLTATSEAVMDCFQQCSQYNEGGAQCTSVTILARPKRKKEKRGSNCFYRKDTTPDLCAQDKRFDTYLRSE